jgi:hypothetical protein
LARPVCGLTDRLTGHFAWVPGAFSVGRGPLRSLVAPGRDRWCSSSRGSWIGVWPARLRPVDTLTPGVRRDDRVLALLGGGWSIVVSWRGVSCFCLEAPVIRRAVGLGTGQTGDVADTISCGRGGGVR